jgi:hypothetical protein
MPRRRRHSTAYRHLRVAGIVSRESKVISTEQRSILRQQPRGIPQVIDWSCRNIVIPQIDLRDPTRYVRIEPAFLIDDCGE